MLIKEAGEREFLSLSSFRYIGPESSGGPAGCVSQHREDLNAQKMSNALYSPPPPLTFSNFGLQTEGQGKAGGRRGGNVDATTMRKTILKERKWKGGGREGRDGQR